MEAKEPDDDDAIPLEEFLTEVGITEADFRTSVKEGLRDFREGRTISHEQLKRDSP